MGSSGIIINFGRNKLGIKCDPKPTNEFLPKLKDTLLDTFLNQQNLCTKFNGESEGSY